MHDIPSLTYPYLYFLFLAVSEIMMIFITRKVLEKRNGHLIAIGEYKDFSNRSKFNQYQWAARFGIQLFKLVLVCVSWLNKQRVANLINTELFSIASDQFSSELYFSLWLWIQKR